MRQISLVGLLLAAVSCAATISSDTILAAIKEAQVNIAEREKNIVTLTEPLEEAQRANADSEFAQLKGDILSEATTILVEKLGSSVLDVLGDIDVDAIMEQSGAARKKREVHGCVKDFDCNSKESNEYRTVTGKCNNVKNITHGAAVTPVRRLLKKASYSDGFTKIRTQGVKGTPLPSTREISNKLHREGAKPGFDYRKNHFFMQFGQWVAHDIIFMPSSVGPNSKALDCTSCDSPKTSENCAPIPVPADDDYFKAFSNGTKRCIRLTRALNAQKGLGVRTQINQNTHFLDLSSVYGSEGCEAAAVRSFSNGELKTFIHNGEVLPPQNKNDSNCQSKAPEYCFVAGDFRNSLHPGLIPMHATYIKEHNRLAALFRNANPGWSDEQIFQETRRVNIAQYQHHVYSEYLPLVLGEKLMTDFNLKPLKSGFSTSYSPSVNAALSAEFSGAAFRYGHGLARKDFPRVTNDNKTAGNTVDLGNNIFYVDSHYAANQGGEASFIEGMLQHPVMKADNEFSFPIRNQLFEIRNKPASGVDLVSVNIMRGRDLGLFPYNEYRNFVGLKKAASFDDLKAEMEDVSVEALKKVYADVNDIDLYTGIMLERPMPGASIGPTGGFIIAEQFSALKRGDRFYYENQVPATRGLTPEQLDAIRRTHLAKVLCGNTPSMVKVNVDVFALTSDRVPCSTIPELEMRPFLAK
ncbi:hypothetical protein Q1695_009566 [Nippostrongylus brasiliensis]|nr:hypothetical protein Q1695_009566 [Nippostrongylus brasiliensis]